MKTSILSVAALALTAGSALAADLPSQKAPAYAPQPPPMWTGFYAGLNAGYGFGTNSNTESASWAAPTNWQSYTAFSVRRTLLAQNMIASGQSFNTTSPNNSSGFIGGVQFGYNSQITEKVVLGLEADFQGAIVSGGGSNIGLLRSNDSVGVLGPTANKIYSYTAQKIGVASTNISSGLNYLGTARGRIGYLFTPTLLAYATGGLAYGGAWANARTSALTDTYVNYALTGFRPGATPPVTQAYLGEQTSRSALLAGFTVGGGFEWMFMPNWSLKVEALYYNLGNMRVTTASVAGGATGAGAPNPNFRAESVFATVGNGLMASSANVNYQGVVARAGVNYHFNIGDVTSIVAKY